MSTAAREDALSAHALLGRAVRDASGHILGHVYDIEVERCGDHLCVAALLVGARAWVTRFGWSTRPHGTRVLWERIERLDPQITVRPGTGR